MADSIKDPEVYEALVREGNSKSKAAAIANAAARDGRVLSPRIERGSGHAALDEEAEALLRRISPLPPLPAAMPQAQLEIVVPISFRLR